MGNNDSSGHNVMPVRDYYPISAILAIRATPYMHLFPPVWCAYLAVTLPPRVHPRRTTPAGPAYVNTAPRRTLFRLIYVRTRGHMHGACHLARYLATAAPLIDTPCSPPCVTGNGP